MMLHAEKLIIQKGSYVYNDQAGIKLRGSQKHETKNIYPHK